MYNHEMYDQNMYNIKPQNIYIPKEPSSQIPNFNSENIKLKKEVLKAVEPFVRYGLNEQKYTNYKHALTEVSSITYLIGMGYDPTKAHKIVESWEINEHF